MGWRDLGVTAGRFDHVAPFVEELLWLYPQSVGDAVDVVEIRADLDCIVDRPVIPADRAEVIDVRSRTVGGRSGCFLRVYKESLGGRVQTCRTPIGCKVVDEFVRAGVGDREIGCDLRPEVVKVCSYSVVALVDL